MPKMDKMRSNISKEKKIHRNWREGNSLRFEALLSARSYLLDFRKVTGTKNYTKRLKGSLRRFRFGLKSSRWVAFETTEARQRFVGRLRTFYYKHIVHWNCPLTKRTTKRSKTPLERLSFLHLASADAGLGAPDWLPADTVGNGPSYWNWMRESSASLELWLIWKK